MHGKGTHFSWYPQALILSENTYMKLHELKWTIMKFSHGFLWCSPVFFVPLQSFWIKALLVLAAPRHRASSLYSACTSLVNVFSKYSSFIMFNDQCSIFKGPHGARPTVFPQHSATFGLAQIQESVARISRTFGFGAAAQTNVSAMRGQHYLPTLRASLRCPFLMPFWALIFCPE